MRKIILAINTTPEGFCDHRGVIPDSEMHQFYADLLKDAGTMLFGRKTYRLLEAYWPDVAKNRTGTKEEIDFADMSTAIQKVVFSKKGIEPVWQNTIVLNDLNESVLQKLKEQPGGDILVGSPTVVDQLIKLGMIDEYIFVVHPIIFGHGKRFFENIKLNTPVRLAFDRARTFESGAIGLFYRSR